jgi:hypothetical protein
MKWVPTLIVLAALALLLSLKPPAAVQAAAPATHGSQPQVAVQGAMRPDHAAALAATTAPRPANGPVGAAAPAAPAQQPADREVVPALLIVPQAPRNADSVTGYVTSPSGRGQAQMSVALVGPDGKPVATTTSAKDGRYTFEHVAPGTYKLTASDPDFLYTTAEAATVTAVSGKAVEANVVLTRGSARIAGTVVDANQKPIADQKMNLSAGGAALSVNTDVKGRFLVNGLVDGSWTVVPDGMPQFSRTIRTNGLDTPEVTISLIKRASLTIRVIGTHLHPLSLKGGAKGYLRPAGKSDPAAMKTTDVVLVDTEEASASGGKEGHDAKEAKGEKKLARDERYGRVTFTDLLPGEWELEIARTGADGKPVSLLTGAAPWELPTPVTLEAGQERDWPLPTFEATRGLGVEVPLGVILFMIVGIGLLIVVTPLIFPRPLAPKRPPIPAPAPASAAPAATPAATAAH